MIVQLRQSTKAMIASPLQEILESDIGIISDYMQQGRRSALHRRRAELVALTKHCANDTFTLPIKITIFSQDNRTARLVIERDGNISRVH